MLEIKNLTKYFHQNKAVDNLSLKIKKGEIYSLIGPNGSGKTTIIKSIIGLLRPDEGFVKVDGKNVLKNPRETKKIIGYIPDDPAVWPEITGEEFLYFTGKLHGFKGSQIKKEIPKLLKYFLCKEWKRNILRITPGGTNKNSPY